MRSFKANKNSLFKKFTTLLIALSYSHIFAFAAVAETTNAGYYPIVFATRNIKAGTFITKCSDVDRVEIRSEERNDNSVFSPLEILGRKVQRDLRKNQIINEHDINFKARLNLQSNRSRNKVDAALIPHTYATRDIKAGSFIKSASDLGVIEFKKKIYPASVFSPREIIGFKTKNNLRKNQAISYVDLDFNNRKNAFTKDVLELNQQLNIARKKWSSTSDDYWELCGPKGDTMSSNEGGGIIVATRNLKKNSIIFDSSNIELIFVPQSHIPEGALGSPLQALGGVPKYAILKNSIVSRQDLVFPQLTNLQRLQFERMKKLAFQKWTGLSSHEFIRRDQ